MTPKYEQLLQQYLILYSYHHAFTVVIPVAPTRPQIDQNLQPRCLPQSTQWGDLETIVLQRVDRLSPPLLQRQRLFPMPPFRFWGEGVG